MANGSERERAKTPDDLYRLFIVFANAGDIEGLADLYEPTAGAMFDPERMASGREEIKQAIEKLLANRSHFSGGGQRPTTIVGDLALTSAEIGPGIYTAEVARRQPDGSWRWVIDVPRFVS